MMSRTPNSSLSAWIYCLKFQTPSLSIFQISILIRGTCNVWKRIIKLIDIFFNFSDEGRKSTWNFIKQNWDVVLNRCSAGHLVTRFVQVSAFDHYLIQPVLHNVFPIFSNKNHVSLFLLFVTIY